MGTMTGCNFDVYRESVRRDNTVEQLVRKPTLRAMLSALREGKSDRSDVGK